MKHSKEFLKTQRENLLQLQDRYLEQTGQKPVAMDHADDMDLASSTTDLEFALTTLSTSRTALLDIQNALKKLEDGTYGICEMSGELIKQERLEAIPFARFTVECKAKMEEQSKYARAQVQQFSLTEATPAEESEELD